MLLSRTTPFILSLLLSSVVSLPTLLVDSPKPKCLSVEAPQDTVFRVEYTAPDSVLDKNLPNYAPSHLSISVMPARRVVDTKLHTSPILNRLKPKTEPIVENKGSITHTMEVDGTAIICIRAQGASSKQPLLFGLRVIKTDNDPIAKVVGSGSDIDGHLSHMELEMQRIQTAMKNILRESDFSKERDAVFHRQTLSMHSATVFWPIVHVCVLLMTGFTQASHIVRFFQTRRII